MYRCITRKTSTRGATPTAAAAKSWGRLSFWDERNVESTTCTVQADGSCPITSGQRNAFQLAIKVRTPRAMIILVEFGSSRRQ